MAMPEIDGGLIGGASLKAEDFSKVASVILGMDDIRAEHIPPMEVEYI